MLLSPLLLFLLSGSVVCHENCSYMEIVNHLGLTTNKDLFTLVRPVKNFSLPLYVKVDFTLGAILDVREIEQTFISYNSIDIVWKNEFISWNEEDFCGLERITVPSELLWKPDLQILEVVEKDKTPASPFLVVKSDGTVMMKNDQVIVSTCKMNAFKFPFDTQRCNLTIKSFIHTIDEIIIQNYGSPEIVRERIQGEMYTQYEWIFEDIDINSIKSRALKKQQSNVVYTVSTRRRAVLYVVNFILPVLFFLALDFASFLMSDTGGDKLGFKITILLAVTVLQLLLNEILPSTSDHMPLIAIFCIGVFWLMKLSLLETIVIMYLLDRDEKHQKRDEKKGEENALTKSSSADLILEHTMDKEDSNGPVDSGSDVDRLVQELRRMCAVLSVGGSVEQEPGYWSRRVASINRVFLLVHSSLTAVFLVVIFHHWLN